MRSSRAADPAPIRERLRDEIERIRAGLDAPDEAAPSDTELRAGMERVGDLFLAMIGQDAAESPGPPPDGPPPALSGPLPPPDRAS